MRPLLLLFALLGGATSRSFNQTVEDRKVGSVSFPSCLVCGIHDWALIGNTCYQVFSDKLTFSEAELACRAKTRGGRLASIHSPSDNLNLLELMKTKTKRAWFGGIHLHSGKHYIWSDGSEFTYQNWAPGEPNKWIGKENCLEMYGNGQWNDNNCDMKWPYVCQYRMNAQEMQKGRLLAHKHA